MSAQHLAQLWEELLARSDHDRLSLEEFGHFDLYHSAVPSNFKKVYSSFGRLFIRLRALFDIQRTSIQLRPLKASLIPLQLHHAILLRLISLGTALPVEQGADLSEYLFHRHLLLHALLSAFRVLILRSDSLEQAQLWDLRDRIQGLATSWEGQIQRSLSEPEDFVLKFLLPQTIDILLDSSKTEAFTEIASGDFQLPESPNPLHPFTLSPKSNHDGSILLIMHQVTQELDNRDWLRAYWTLYDIIWAIIASAVTREPGLPKLRQGKRNTNVAIDALTGIFGQVAQSPQFQTRISAKNSLSDFFAPYNATMLRCYDTTAYPTPSVFDAYLPWQKHRVDVEWEAFFTYVVQRRLQMSALYNPTTAPLAKATMVPLSTVPPPRRHYIEHMQPPPELASYPAPLSPSVVESIPEEPIQEHATTTVQNGSLHSIAPPRSPPPRNTAVGFVDLPLDVEKLPSRMQSMSSRGASSIMSNPRSRADSDNGSIYPEGNKNYMEPRVTIVESNPPIVTRAASVSTESSSKKMNRFLNFKPSSVFFGNKPVRSVGSIIPDNLTLSFSHTGRSLLFYNRNDCDFFIWADLLQDESRRCSLLYGEPPRVKSATIKCISASDNAVAVLAHYQGEVSELGDPLKTICTTELTIQQGDKLFHYSDQGIRCEAQANTHLGNRGANCFTCAISPNGTLIALGWGLTVQLYKYDGRSLNLLTALLVHESHSGAVARYQRLNFSLDSEKLVSATQELVDAHKHAIYIRIWNCAADSVNAQFRPQGNTVTVGYGDDTGVTSVFFDPNTVRTFMAANLSKSYYGIIGMNGYRTVLEGLTPRNIDLVGQGPSGKHFVLKTAKNNRIYLLDLGNGEISSPIDLDPDRRGAKQEIMALAMPEHDMVFAAAREGSAFVLKKLNILGGKAVQSRTEDLGSIYQRGLAAG